MEYADFALYGLAAGIIFDVSSLMQRLLWRCYPVLQPIQSGLLHVRLARYFWLAR